MADGMTIESERIRMRILKASFQANKGHIGSALSICEVVTAIHKVAVGVGTESPSRTRVVLSKGHASISWYASLVEFGIIGEEDLFTYGSNGTKYGTHPDSAQSGSDFMTGSLGQGVGFGVGSALAAKMQNMSRLTFVVLSDSELNEGSTWESLFLAGHQNLEQLIVILDLNGQQALGKTSDVLNLRGVPEILSEVGWDVVKVDGHDVRALVESIAVPRLGVGRPLLVIAKTTAGKGVSFMEGKVEWHYMPLNPSQFESAEREVLDRIDNFEISCAV